MERKVIGTFKFVRYIEVLTGFLYIRVRHIEVRYIGVHYIRVSHIGVRYTGGRYIRFFSIS